MRIDAGDSLVIRGADVIDGSGAPRFAADVVVTNGLITAVMTTGKAVADHVMDAHGLVPAGIHAVLVNGQLAWLEGRQINGHAGLRLRP